MAEGETLAQQGQGDEVPEITQAERGQVLAQPKPASAPSPQPDASVPSTSVVGTEVPPPPPPAPGRATTGWTEEMEVSLMGSSIKEEHRTQIDTALQVFRSAEVGMHEIFKSLIKSFEVFTILTLRVTFLLRFIYKPMYPSKDVFNYTAAWHLDTIASK
jgi:hypothetical protein